MSTQDDDLKLEPPQAPLPSPPPAPAPPPEPPAPAEPPAPPEQRAAESDLESGRGRPLVEGPPMSVDEPISEQSINRTAAFAGIGLLGIGLIVLVVVLLVVVFAVCTHR
jgi:hypothetical protein